MGQVITSNAEAPTALATKNVGAGYMGEFGNGLFRVFYANDSFTVPDNVSKIRVRVVGAGGGGKCISASTKAGAGGGGGGYAHGVFAVTPGQVFAVTVGLGGDGGTSATAGGGSSFGALISATGGSASTGPESAAGGVGTGGDFQASGGASYAANGSSGAASGSQLGNGGRGEGTNGTFYGGAVGGSEGRSPFGKNGQNITGNVPLDYTTTTVAQLKNPTNAIIRFPFDGFVGTNGVPTGGTNPGVYNSPGCGGPSGYDVTAGAGGGGGGNGGGSGTDAGTGGIGGGGGGTALVASTKSKGGNGLVIVEW